MVWGLNKAYIYSFLFIFFMVVEVRATDKPIFINVKEYGAKGDGKTDDWESIEKAIARLDENGGVLFFPKGTYMVGNAITLKSNVTYRGASKHLSFIKATPNSLDNVLGKGYPLYLSWKKARAVGGNISRLIKPDFVSQYTEEEAFKTGGMAGTAVVNVVIENLTIDGNKDKRAENKLNLRGRAENLNFLAGETIISEKGATAVVAGVFGGEDGFSIEPSTRKGEFSQGDIVYGTTSGAKMKVTETRADDAYQMLIRFDAVSHSIIRNCILKNAIFTAVSIYNYSNNNTIENNIFSENNKSNTDFTWGRINVFIEFDAYGNKILNNTIHGGLGYGILVQSAGGANYDTVISGNKIFNPGADGIRLGNETTISPIERATIRKNIIEGANAEGAVAIRIIHYGEGKVAQTVVEQNVIRDCTYGIVLQGRVENTKVRNNTVAQCKQGGILSTAILGGNIVEANKEIP